MKVRRSVSENLFDGFNIVFMILLMVITLYPFWYVVVASISDPIALMKNRGAILLPLGNPTLEAYKAVFNNKNVGTGYKNTLIYLVSGTALNVTLTTLGAYALSRKDLYFRDHVMMFISFTMFFSGGLIPTYMVINSLGLINTRWVMIIPGAISAYNLIIMRTSIAGIPDSIEESALIDGANEFQILWRIIVPLSLPVISVITLYYGVSHWNAWFSAMIYLSARRDLWPLQLFLRELLIMNKADALLGDLNPEARRPLQQIINYAMIVIATVPILSIYPMLQRYFVKGVMIGAIKG